MIIKTALDVTAAQPCAADLEAINALARRELAPDEVYVFGVKLCDNEIDRDFERFSDECLDELAPMFVGKTGLLDHNWTASGQLARIFRAEVETDAGRLNSAGEPYRYIKAWAYMLRSEATEGFIAAIDAGIVRETSVGCSVEHRTCSICGEENCRHVPGRSYDGELCHKVLSGAVDAYEWSFVAVPAQREAGVIKSAGCSLRGFVATAAGKGFRAEFERLEKLAAEGERLLERERAEVRRLGLLWDEQMAGAVARAAENMDAGELAGLRERLEKKLAGRFPPVCQLPGLGRDTRFDGDDYII